MSPGVNDGPRKTGTLPKSNRRNERNQDIPNQNRQIVRPMYNRRLHQHPNNLLDWQPVSDREQPVRGTKDSNTRSTSSVPSTSYQDLVDIGSFSNRHYNYTGDDYVHWQDMAQPVDPRVQSPPNASNAKPTNVDKMPDRQQVKCRLSQIRDYIRVTSTMMDSLNQSSDPRARAQYDKLAKMVEDLCDSETKLTKLLEDYRGLPEEHQPNDGNPPCSVEMKRFTELLDMLASPDRSFISNINHRSEQDGEESLESKLRKKMEASQRKLAQLQEHQANLVGMQLQVRERLNEARHAQQLLLLQENEESSPGGDNENRSQQQLANDADDLESETAALRGKLAQLQNKKKQMDSLIAELQAADILDGASCSSDTSKTAERDKAAELDVLKAQLAHLKGLMEDAMRYRDTFNSAETESEANAVCENGDVDEDGDIAASCNSFDRNSETDEMNVKINNSKEKLTVEQIHAVTRELREQQALLQTARAELQRLKNPSAPQPAHLLPGTSSPSFSGFTNDKKQSNNHNNNNNNNNNQNNNSDIPQNLQLGLPDGQSLHSAQAVQAQNKKRQLEELVRKDPSHSSSVNRDNGATGWGSRRGSNSHRSRTSTPANIWPGPTAVVGSSNEQSVDGISTTDNLLDIGGHVPTLENGFPSNWWNLSAPPPSQPPQGPGSTEYYRQLLMSSQAQQLQMMSTTMQQCCQLLWAQQRELQSMRSAITQLQQQFRQGQPPANENREGYSNLSRSVHHLENTLDSTLPPSSSLPNLVSLPPSSQASHPPVVAQTNSQQHQNNQQLNNQVPPGNRANNYWDNFRSYSRQNLLSGTPKTMTDSMAGPSGHVNATTNTTASGLHMPNLRDKRNREHATDNLSLPSLGSEGQYSLNLQLQSNLQSHDREMPAARTNVLSNEAAQAMQQVENFWEDAHSSFRLVPETNDDIYSLRHLNTEMRDVLLALVAANRTRPDYLVIILREIKAIIEDQRLRPRLLRSLRALQDVQSANNPLNEVPDHTASESCQSSDDDSDAGAQATSLLNSTVDSQSFLPDMFVSMNSSMPGQPSLGSSIVDFDGAMQLPANIDGLAAISSINSDYNGDLAEADQSRPNASNDQQNSFEEVSDDGDNESSQLATAQGAAALEVHRDPFLAQGSNDDELLAESSILDRIPTRLHHH